MDNIRSNILILKENPSLKSLLFEYIRKQIELGKLELLAIEFPLNNLLIENSILEKEGDLLTMKDIDLISFSFFEHYKAIFEFKLSSNFDETFDFLKIIEKAFLNKKKVVKWNLLKLSLFKVVIWISNYENKIDFCDFIDRHYLEVNQNIKTFFKAYNHTLKDLNIVPQSLYSNAKKILMSPAIKDGEYINDLPVRNSIKNKCSVNLEFGLELFKLVNNDSVINHVLFADILCILFTAKRSNFFKDYIEKLLKNEKLLPHILTGLSHVEILDNSSVILYSELIKRFKENIDLDNNIILLIFGLLKHGENLSIRTVNLCFSELFKKSERSDNGQLILQELFYLTKYIEQIGNLVVNIVRKEYFNLDIHFRLVYNILFKAKDVVTLKKVLVGIAESNPFKTFPRRYDDFSVFFNPKEFELLIIEFLTNDKSSIRFIGKELFDTTHSSKTFSINILELPYIVQYKLWVSLTSDLKEPKYVIPALIPLIDSSSVTVREIFILKLEYYLENYIDSFLSIVKRCLDCSNLNHLNVLNRLESYQAKFLKENFDLKKGVKELDPFYTDNKNYSKFWTFFRKKINRSLSDKSKENSLIALFGSEIILAKGGGWTTGNREDISKLGKFESNFTLPRDYFIDPIEFEMFEIGEMKRDWEDGHFLEIENFISNE